MKTYRLIVGVTTIICGLLASAQAQYTGPTNYMVWNFDTEDQTLGWGNWFGNDFVGVSWDPTVDANGNPNSGSLKLVIDANQSGGFNQWVLWDGATPYYSGLPLVGTVMFTNLSFDMRYDESSAIRTNADGSLDFGVIRVGSRSPTWGQDWFYYWTVPATNGAGLPNTNWIHVSVDLTTVPTRFSDLAGSGIVNIIIGQDNGNYNPNLKGLQTIWFDNFKFSGYVAPMPPPTLSIEKTTPALRLFGGSGIYGRSQVRRVGMNDSWVDGDFPVIYSFTILDNATSPGNLDVHIHLIQGTDNYSGADWTQPNVFWLQIISGTGTNTACVANVSWKTNTPGANPNQTSGGRIELQLTNPVLAGTWTLVFSNNTSGALIPPGGSPVPFTISLTEDEVRTYFSNPLQLRIGIQNYGNAANGGIPHDFARIFIKGTAGTPYLDADFTKANTTQLDPEIWDTTTSDGVGVVVLVPTNAPYWIKWTTPDTGFQLLTGNSLTDTASWTTPQGVVTTLQAGLRWALVPANALPAGNAAYFALLKPPFTQLQILLPGETNAPGTPTGKVGTPVTLNWGDPCTVTVLAVDSNYRIASYVSGDTIALGCSDPMATLPEPTQLRNGIATMTVYFGNTGTFTITATNLSNPSIPPATSSPISVVLP